MRRNSKGVLILVLLLLIVALTFREGPWDRYYKNKIHKPPRTIVIEALTHFKNPGTAIDLGCGVGNESALLLRKGWKVWAIDSQPKAIQMLRTRNDLVSPDSLMTITARFDRGLDWKLLPPAELLCASYALPFCLPEQFATVWEEIKGKLNPGGTFVGHFFGKKYEGFSDYEKKEMTFLTREEVEALFQDFDIELFEEVEANEKSGTGKKIHSHVFEVIAKKKK